jgi:hypothetical protein
MRNVDTCGQQYFDQLIDAGHQRVVLAIHQSVHDMQLTPNRDQDDGHRDGAQCKDASVAGAM